MDDLFEIRNAMKSRVEAIEMEIVRREFEAEKVVLEFLAKRYKDNTLIRRSYSQQY